MLKILRTGAPDNVSDLPPLLHIHIPKCGGTTLDYIMVGVATILGRSQVRFYGSIYGQKFSGIDKRESSKEARGYPPSWMYAAGHIPFGRFPPHGACRTVSIIRDPIARQISMFQMGVKRKVWPATTPVPDLFKAGHLVANSMVRQLSGATTLDDLRPWHVEMALRNFQALTYKGSVDDFDAIVSSVLADYGFPYFAYYRAQVGQPIDEATRNRLAVAFPPYVELDQEFFGRAAALRYPEASEVALEHLTPDSPILLVNPWQIFQESGSSFIMVKAEALIAALSRGFSLLSRGHVSLNRGETR